MREADLPYAFVTGDGEIEGAVRLRDAEHEAECRDPKLENIIMPVDEEVRKDDNLISILAKASGKLSPLPVVDENGELVGAVTKDMLLRAVSGEEEE
jgi:CBS domain-containing protein